MHVDPAHLGHQGGLAVGPALRRLAHEPQRRLTGVVAEQLLARCRRPVARGQRRVVQRELVVTAVRALIEVAAVGLQHALDARLGRDQRRMVTLSGQIWPSCVNAIPRGRLRKPTGLERSITGRRSE